MNKPGWSQTVGRIDSITKVFIYATILIILINVFFLVVTRNFGIGGGGWVFATSNLAVIWLTWSGTAIASARQEHLKVDVLERYFGQAKFFIICKLTARIAAIICFLILTIFGAKFCIHNAMRRYDTLPLLSKAWSYSAAPVGCFFALVWEAIAIRRMLRKE